ncbi:TetR/AcrR family transcriptional regulator [Williamsia muralis]|uniref:TetR/AcrR family transcriptional regulator n=1 Tax=Williamsia marianensis TaxID=85044 RepID=UPI0037F102A8
MDRERMVDAAIAVVERFGARALSLTSVARHAGVGRATAYRMFGGRDQLVQAIVEREVKRLGALIAEWTASESEPADKVRVLVLNVLDYIRNHEALQYILKNEPEEIITTIVARGPDRTSDVTIVDLIVANSVGNFATEPELEAALVPDAGRATEMMIRIIYSYMLIPRSALSDDDIADMVVRSTIR